jgi:KilA-N domain
MNSSIIRSWNGRTIRQREDGYLSATDMCQACGKLFGDWNRLSSSNAYLEALSSDMGIPISQIVEVKKGNSSEYEQGTWLLDLAALELARWLSPEFAIQCNKWVRELLLKGKVELTVDPKAKALAQAKEALEIIREYRNICEYSLTASNVRLQAICETTLIQVTDAFVLPYPEKQPILNGQPAAITGNIQYEGVVDVVIRLGLKFDNRFESSLGNYAGKQIPHLRISTSDDKLKDYRASQASGKVIPAYMYPAFNSDVERVVKDFCYLMEAKQWMTQTEIKNAKKQAKLTATLN